MATPSPHPAALASSELPAPTPAPPAMPSGPVCAACGEPAVVHWQRRPTDDELAELVAAEQSRRDERLLLADPQLPAPQFGPLPTAGDTTRIVHACAEHAIGLEAAALIHQATCTAPAAGPRDKLRVDADEVPVCDCTPEHRAEPAELLPQVQAPSRLPAHWVSGGV
ncbi:hypothetical protein [Streptomyces cylindrosporus]|uniref:Uncharacterized protein n=1 Tax=Streptomyces cylindrosporus TaxID=2927583 RepID=A0ABS9YKD4_9ACTN|nr:hypothetical protein [Streptomyces cylindrosporus]MCI3277644.1 hypothetical protein [Streptomyces cylindrosporus]